MKHLFAILSLFFFFTSSASHLVGGEITYNHIGNNSYEVLVTLYRDCQDSKLGGTGGGTSTSNSADLEEVYLRTITGACGNTSIGKITLTKLGYTDITAICNSASSKCQNNSDYGYGIEAHYYKGSVDFDNYSQYSGCTIQIFFDKAERSNSLTTLSSEENNLFNFAIINPWNGNFSSPKFLDAPKIIFNANQPTYCNDGISHNTGDSIAIKWSKPYSNYNTPLNYTGNFSKEYFISTYCPTGTICDPNPNASIPEGLYLNSKTGDYIFTPTNSNQKSTRVIEVEQWRKISGSMILTGMVRRDVQVIITNENYNNPPKIQTDDVHYACVGQEFTTTISASDNPQTVGGTALAYDSVHFKIDHTLSNLSTSLKNISTAPYQNVEFSITPTTSDIGTHYIHIKAKDNYCPEYAESNKVITLIISPAPTIDFIVEDVFCGNNKILLNSNRSGTFNMTVTDGATNIYSNDIAHQDVITYYKKATLTYALKFTDDYGCIATLEKNIENNGNTTVGDALVKGRDTYCANDMTSISLLHSSYTISNTNWINNGILLSNEDTLKIKPFNGIVEAHYKLLSNSYECEMSKQIELVSNLNPEVTVNDIPDLCYTPSYNMATISANPSGGIWDASSVSIANNILNLKSLPNDDQSIIVEYTYTSSETGCSTSIEKSINILKSPEMKLREEAICGDKYEYRLTNAIERPFHHAVENITWKVLSNPSALLTDPYMAIDIPTYGSGSYQIEAQNTYNNGCISTDSAIITVDEGLTITTNGLSSICQQDNVFDLDEYFALNAKGGGWVSPDAGELLNLKNFTPSKCGTYTFHYVYDKNGCYDELEIPLEVICKPNFQFDLPDSICSNNAPLTLDASSLWKGFGVKNNTFYPEKLLGSQTLTQSISADGCIFDTVHTLVVIEPLSIDLGNLPLSLCEGSQLDITIFSKSYTRSELKSCSGKTPITNNKVHYSPTSCDLMNNHIALRIITTSDVTCPALSTDINVKYYEKPSVLLPDNVVACAPQDISYKLLADKGYNASITHSLFNQYKSLNGDENIQYTFLDEGKYSLRVFTEDDNGCTNVQVAENYLTIFPKPESNFEIAPANRVTLSERELYLNNRSYITSGYNSYSWSLEKYNQSKIFSTDPNPIYLLPADTGLFEIQLIANSNNNCKDTSRQVVRVVPDIIIFIPNAFTPNDKGPESNNKFTVSSAHAQEYFIEIFNKWGQRVYASTNINESWDGNYLGKLCQDGVYAYSIDLINKAGLKYTYHGTVNLIR